MDAGSDPQKGLMLNERWANLKPRVIRPLGEHILDPFRSGLMANILVAIDRIREAYDLAENHYDLPTLVWLCHDPVAGSGQARIQRYIERFGEEFAFILYEWYIQQGQPHGSIIKHFLIDFQASCMLF